MTDQTQPAKDYVKGEWKRYRKRQLAEMRPYVLDEELDGVSVSQADIDAGSPKQGDMIARNPDNPGDRWLVSKAFFEQNYEQA